MSLHLNNKPIYRILFFSAALLPIVLVALYIYRFGVNIPFMDQWEVVPLLEKQGQGLLAVTDLVAQHNEHRPLFPRLIWLTLSRFTHYNVNAELWVNLLIALGTFIFFINRAGRTWEQLGVSVPPLLIPLLSLLVFNLGQREAWLQGFQTALFLQMACVVIGLFTLAENASWRNFLIALVLGVIATYSMINGLFYWLVGFLVILTATPKNLLGPRIFLWLLSSVVCISLFLSGWTSGGHINPAFILTHPFEWGIWLLNFLGAPIMTSWYIAWVFGLIAVILYILMIRQTIKNDQWKQLIPYFGIVFFIVLTDLSISLGRIESGLPQSTVSRYLTVSVWHWACLLVMLPLLDLKKLHQLIFYSLITVSLLALTILGGWRGYVTLHQRMQPVYQAVVSGGAVSDDLLMLVYPDPDTVRPRLEYLCENHLSACANVP